MKIHHIVASSITALIATGSLSAIAQAGTIRYDRSDTEYRNLATLFPSVGSLNLRGSSGGWLCSGTLLNSSWLLTAAHCIDNVQSGSFTVGGSTYAINAAITNQGWLNSNRNLGAGFDLGLFRLNRAVTNVTGASLFRGRDEDLQVGTYVGFGATGTGLTGYNPSSGGTKRAGQNLIGLGTRLGYSNQLLVSDFDDPRRATSDPSSQPLNLEYNVAPGDSGGGLFINGLLAGVNSFISETDGSAASRGLQVDADYGDFSAATRVSSFAPWIDNILRGITSSTKTAATSTNRANSTGAQASESFFEELGNLPEIEILADIYDNDEIQSIPESSTVLGLVLAVTFFLLSRRRQAA